jgi:transposase
MEVSINGRFIQELLLIGCAQGNRGRLHARLGKWARTHKEKRVFGTTTRELLNLADWLNERSVTHIVMESTGVYWKPLWNILEGQFDITLVNAQHFKSVPGRKTDLKDGEWLGDLLQHGLLRKSFVPPKPIRELRDLTRSRATLAQEKVRFSAGFRKYLRMPISSWHAWPVISSAHPAEPC